jgi:hypothetical protein
VGCDQGSNTELNGENSYGTWIIPRVGSTFIFHITQPIDTTEPGPPLREFDTIAVIGTGEFVGGKTNVIRLRGRQEGKDDFLYRIESNGDFSICDSSFRDTVSVFTWTTYPISGPSSISEPRIDTVYDGFEHYTRSVDRVFVGYENLFLAGQQFQTIHSKEVSREIHIDSLHGIADTTGSDFDFWLVPSMGVFVKTYYEELAPSSYEGGFELVRYIR